MSNLAAPPIIRQTEGLVTGTMAESRGLANSAMTRGLAAIETLSAFAVSIPDIAVPAFAVPTITLPAVGVAPADPGDLTVDISALPGAPQAQDIGALVVGEVPTDSTPVPLLIDIPLPDPLAAIVPPSPVLADVATPVEPGFVLPVVPDFTTLNLPAAPVFDMPLFDSTAPTAPQAIDVSFSWSEVEYSTTELTALNARLLDLVNGASTGLAPEVEDAIWQKGCDDEVMASYQAVDAAMAASSARGFMIPGGALVRVVQQAIEDGINKDSELSRKVMVDQAMLEQSNFHFAFTNAMQLEGRLMELFNQVQGRALEAEQFRVSSLIELFNARVSLYQADVQAFRVKAEVFTTRLQAALAQLEAYRAELEGVRLIGQLNVQLTQQYSAQISAVQAMTDVYKARVSAVALTVENNKTRTEQYRSEIEGYTALGRASAAQAQGYLTQVQAEQAKVEMFSEQVRAYSSQVSAYQSLTSAKLAEANFQFRQLQEFPVALYKAKIAGYQVQVSAEAARLAATADVFRNRVEAYAAVERTAAQRASASADVLSTTTRLYTSQAQVSLQAGTVSLNMAKLKEETAQSALRAAGILSTQLASAAMSARNVSASITGATSNSVGLSATNHKSKTASTGVNNSSHTAVNSSSNSSVSDSATVHITNSQTLQNSIGYSESFEQSASTSNETSTSNEHSTSARNSSSFSFGINRRYGNSTIYRHKGK